jgi:hypothetical protein
MSSMDRFTKRAKQVLYYAQEEARYFNQPYVGTEHILLGLIRDQDHFAGRILAELGVKHAPARSAVEFIVGHGEGSNRHADLELAAGAKKVIEYALEEGRKLNHHYVGTEHLLLGLVRKGEGVAAGVLEIMGVSLEQVRTSVLRDLRQRPNSGLERSSQPKQRRTGYLDTLSTDLTEMAEAGQRDPRSGRQQEAEPPLWAETPLFEQEARLHGELQALQAKVTELQGLIGAYHLANILPFVGEGKFNEAVPKFFASHLGITIYRDQHHKEDFWITDAHSQKLVMVGTKTYVREFKKGGIYALYSHRESYNLDPNFPALLVVNTHASARSWTEKLRPIDRQDYELAAQDKVLIVRIEDLLYFWNAIVERRLDQAQLITLFLNEHGWLEVQADGTFRVHRT